MKRSWLGLCFLLPLNACGSGGGGSVPTPAIQSVPQTQQVESQTEPLAALSFAPSSDLLYVGNVGNNSITVYKHDAQGNTAPIKVIAGSKTGISAPSQLSEDAQGNLYVANVTSVLVFAHGANGNVAPIRKITGSLTGFHDVETVTVDKSTGKLFVMDENGGNIGFDSSLLRFAPNANGNVAPFARSDVSYPGSYELANDSTGQNILSVHGATGYSVSTAGVQTLVKQFPNGASPNPVYDLTGYLDNNFYPSGIADDPTTKTYLISTSNGISRVAEKTVDGNDGQFHPAFISTITSDLCGSQLALGYLRNIYVTHSVNRGSCRKDGVYVYSHDSSGNVPPLRVLSGPATKMNQPYGIYEGK